jgi:hypothetical protein
MNEEILAQAMALFDTPEKWNAFLELSYNRDLLRDRWYGCLLQKIIELSNITPNYELWGVIKIDNWGVSWYLNEFNWNSVVIHSWAGYNVRIWLRVSEDKRKNIYELLNTDKFIPLFSCFDKIRTRNIFPNEFPIEGHISFDFQSNFEGDWTRNALKFSWYAGNETEKVANQILNKINRFRTPEITELLIELNKECVK